MTASQSLQPPAFHLALPITVPPELSSEAIIPQQYWSRSTRLSHDHEADQDRVFTTILHSHEDFQRIVPPKLKRERSDY